MKKFLLGIAVLACFGALGFSKPTSCAASTTQDYLVSVSDTTPQKGKMKQKGPGTKKNLPLDSVRNAKAKKSPM